MKVCYYASLKLSRLVCPIRPFAKFLIYPPSTYLPSLLRPAPIYLSAQSAPSSPRLLVRPIRPVRRGRYSVLVRRGYYSSTIPLIKCAIQLITKTNRNRIFYKIQITHRELSFFLIGDEKIDTKCLKFIVYSNP